MYYRELITNDLKYYLREVVGAVTPPMSIDDKRSTYTESGDYLLYTTQYHTDAGMAELMNYIYKIPARSVIDAGCCSGFTGLLMALKSYYDVIFHDFEGLGLKFIRWFIEKHSLNAEVVPYGEKIDCADLAIALDVIEHTGNHLSFIRWMNGLGRSKVICYPLMAFAPPYVDVMDEWVDDEAIRQIVGSRYETIFDWSQNGRRFLGWR